MTQSTPKQQTSHVHQRPIPAHEASPGTMYEHLPPVLQRPTENLNEEPSQYTPQCPLFAPRKLSSRREAAPIFYKELLGSADSTASRCRGLAMALRLLSA